MIEAVFRGSANAGRTTWIERLLRQEVGGLTPPPGNRVAQQSSGHRSSPSRSLNGRMRAGLHGARRFESSLGESPGQCLAKCLSPRQDGLDTMFEEEAGMAEQGFEYLHVEGGAP